jgi:hypothetical protein
VTEPQPKTKIHHGDTESRRKTKVSYGCEAEEKSSQPAKNLMDSSAEGRGGRRENQKLGCLLPGNLRKKGRFLEIAVQNCGGWAEKYQKAGCFVTEEKSVLGS